MNSRITVLFFALLLAVLWVFGFIVARKKAAGDQSLIMPTLQGRDAKIDKVVIENAEKKGKVELVEIDERWFLKDGAQQARVEGIRVKDRIIREISDAKPDETADVSGDPAHYGLTTPQVVVTLSGKYKDSPKDWKFFIGKESADKALVYVSASDRPDKIFAVPKKSIEDLFIKNVNDLRSKRLFDFGEINVTGILVKKAGDNPLEVKRDEQNRWSFVSPPIGFAGFESPPDETKKEPFPKAPSSPGGVKGLLDSITKVQVDDESHFVPLGNPLSDFGLEKGKEAMRIEVSSSNEKKEITKEILLIGSKVRGVPGDFYYARLDSDDGVVEISESRLAPIKAAVKDPGKLRSRDVGGFDPKKIDAVTLTQGKDETKFFLLKDDEKKSQLPELAASHWFMVREDEKKKANASAVDTLMEQVLGKKAIVKFLDVPEADVKKKEAEWGLDAPRAVISLYVGAAVPAKKVETKDEKKDAKKDDKKSAKKDAKDKKEAAKKEPLPTLKTGAKAVITLAIGKIDKDHVYVRRTLEDGKTVSRFTMKKEFVEKILPSEGVPLAYLSTELPRFEPENVTAMKLQRTTDKGTEVLELERRDTAGKGYWYIKDALDPKGVALADRLTCDGMVRLFANHAAKKWLKKLGDKEDLAPFGLDKPAVIVTFTVDKVPQAARAAAMLAGISGDASFLTALAGLVAQKRSGKEETITIAFGKETDVAKDKPGTFATHSKTKLLFLFDSNIVKMVKERDLRDRTFMMNAHAMRVASYLVGAEGNPRGLLNLASPQITGVIHDFDLDKIKEIRLQIRTPFELRSFDFDRVAKPKAEAKEPPKQAGKDKDKGKKQAKDKEKMKENNWTWKADKSNIPEFHVDPEKVAQLVKDFAKLRTDRFVAYVGGPRSEHKLDAKEASIRLELVFEEGKPVVLSVGASYQNHGFFANSSYWPDTVFFIPGATVEPILRGAGYFGKARSNAN